MGKGSKSGAPACQRHAKNRVDGLLGMFQRSSVSQKREPQVHQMLPEWKAEHIEPSPTFSLQQVPKMLTLDRKMSTLSDRRRKGGIRA